MTTNKLVVLDIDNTLLHTWMPTALPPFIAPDDPHRTEAQRKLFATRLLAEYPGASVWNDAIICPRPHLDDFIHSLIYDLKVKIALYSTAAPFYIAEVLQRLPKDAVTYAWFIWAKDKCIKVDGKRRKDLSRVSKEFDVDLKDIIMIDDLPVVMPEQNRLAINPFRVDINLELAINDDQLNWAYMDLFEWRYGDL